jgi:sugar-specific transcriptional regulator TrmB
MENGDLLERLKEVYLSPYEANAYLSLLYHNSLTAKDLTKVSGIPKQRTNDVLGSLEKKGLAQSHPGKARVYKAIIPEIALNQLIQKKEQQYGKEIRQKYDLAKELTTELSGIIAARDLQDLPPAEYIWTISGNIGEVYSESVFKSEKYIYELLKEPYGELPPQEMAYGKALDKGVDVRFIIQKGRGDGITKFLKNLDKMGAKVRGVNHVPAKLAIIDDKEVWMALLNPNYLDESFTALVIKHPSTASLEKQFFERLWEEGEKI